MTYTVMCASNYHYGSDDDSYRAGKFETFEEARAKCRLIVQRCHDEAFRPGMTAEDLYATYKAFGEDPYIVPRPKGKRFSAWKYAEKLAGQMCDARLGRRYDAALKFAAELHRDQVRKGSNVPYLSHLLAVSGLVMEYGGYEDQAIAALLHDAIEDQSEKAGGADALRKIILDRFGDTVLCIVEACTDSDTEPKPPWKKRKEAYLAHLTSAQVPPYAFLVSSCDKLHNVRSIVSDFRKHGDAMFKRFTGGKKGTLWYYRALVDVYRGIEYPTAVEELDVAVTEMERLAGRA